MFIGTVISWLVRLLLLMAIVNWFLDTGRLGNWGWNLHLNLVGYSGIFGHLGGTRF
jgi:hypothetical protein